MLQQTLHVTGMLKENSKNFQRSDVGGQRNPDKQHRGWPCAPIPLSLLIWAWFAVFGRRERCWGKWARQDGATCRTEGQTSCLEVALRHLQADQPLRAPHAHHFRPVFQDTGDPVVGFNLVPQGLQL